MFFLKTDILPKHKQGAGQASGSLLLQGNCSSDDVDEPTIKSFAAAQVIPFKKLFGHLGGLIGGGFSLYSPKKLRYGNLG